MKKLFNTPKKAIITTISLTAIVLASAVIVPTVILNSTLIGKDAAKGIALEDAGLTASEISGCLTELDFEDGHFRYEVDFYSNGTEYEYLILAKDGGILSRDVDGNATGTASKKSSSSQLEKKTASLATNALNKTAQTTTVPRADTSAQNTTLLSLDAARAAALTDAGLTEAEVTFTKSKLQQEDGTKVYDIAFYTADAEYDYEITAADGSIRERETNAIQAAVLSVDEAKATALADAGLTEADVTFTKSRLDRDDSVSVYEIVFYTAEAKYEYEVNAADGIIQEQKTTPFRSAVISVDTAKAAALADAGLTEADVTFIRTDLDEEDAVQVYEIVFYTSEAEYDYEINGFDGTVREYDIDSFQMQIDAENADASGTIGIDEAKKLAIAHAGLTEAEVTFSKAKLENDDRRTEYEIAFYVGNTEYEYNIDAVTGDILEYHSEAE